VCRPMSGYAAIIVNDDVKLWVSERTDSHAEVAEEFKLRDNGKHRLYAFEFYPHASNPSPDTATWVLSWDSGATLAYRDKPNNEDAERFRREIEKLAGRYVFKDGSHKTTACRAWVFGEAELTARDSSRVEARGSSRVEARDSSSVVAWGSSRVVARDSSRVVALGSSRVEARDSSTTNSYGPKPTKLHDNAVWIDRSGAKPAITTAESEAAHVTR
jgi:hypothetical protein